MKSNQMSLWNTSMNHNQQEISENIHLFPLTLHLQHRYLTSFENSTRTSENFQKIPTSNYFTVTYGWISFVVQSKSCRASSRFNGCPSSGFCCGELCGLATGEFCGGAGDGCGKGFHLECRFFIIRRSIHWSTFRKRWTFRICFVISFLRPVL